MKKYSLLSAFLLWVSISQAQTALEDSWITNGSVDHIVTGGGKTFLVGGFQWFGPAYYGGTIAFDNTLVEDESFPKIEEEVLTAIVDDAGGWYLAVQTSADNYTSKIIHIHADKTIDDLTDPLDGSIKALAKSGNTLYFGGYFQSVNGTTRNSAAAINLTNNTLTSWDPNVDVNGYINTLAVSGSVIYAGGMFTTIGGQARKLVAALDATTGLATSWNVTVTGNSFAEVNTILINAGSVYIGGYFDNVNASAPTRRNFASVNATTAAVETFNPRPDGRVLTLLLDGGMLYMAGGFDRVYNTVRFRVARIEVATSTLMPFEAVFFSNTHSNFYGYDQVNAIGIDGNKLFIGGTFPGVNGEQQPHVAELNKITGALTPSDKRIYGEVSTILISGGTVFVGGYIIGHLGKSVYGVAVLDEATGTGLSGWTDNIPPAPEDEYYQSFDFHYQDDRIYYYLNMSDGTTRIGALDADDGSAIDTWSVTINHHISGWAFSDDALYLSDEGTDAMTINGETRERFAAVDLVTGALLPFTIDFPLALNEHYITSLAIQNNMLYTAGDFFFTENGIERERFAAWDATTGALLPWHTFVPEFSVAEDPQIAAVTNSKIYLIGNGQVRRVNPATGELDETWLPQYNGVERVAVRGTSVFLTGEFATTFIQLDATTAQPTTWQPSYIDPTDMEGSIRAIAVSQTKLHLGGDFNYEINGITRFGYAEYLLPTSTNSAPTIAPTVQSAPIQGIISIYLAEIVTDAEDNIDFSTATIITPPSSGATAYIEDGYLIIDYSQTPFSGSETLTLSVCDTEGACTEQVITIESSGDIAVYNAVSPNGDGKNDILRIQYIDVIPEAANNRVTIFNRWGDIVFETTGYNNDDRVFAGMSKNNKELPAGTYYYKIEYSGKTKTGYLSLRR